MAHLGSERESEADLPDPLFGLLEIPSIRNRLHEAGLLRAGRGVNALRGNRQRRILRVEQVEHFGDGFNPARLTYVPSQDWSPVNRPCGPIQFMGVSNGGMVLA